MVPQGGSSGRWTRADTLRPRPRFCTLMTPPIWLTNSTSVLPARAVPGRLALPSNLRFPQLQMATSITARRTSSPYSAWFPDRKPHRAPLHAFVIRPAAALGRHPIDDLIRIGDVAGFAVHAVRKIDLQSPPALFLNHLVNSCRTEILARIPVLDNAAIDANVRVQNVQVAGLVFLVPCAGMIDVRQPVECEHAIALKAWRSRTRPVELMILLVAGLHPHRVYQATPAGHKLHGRVRQAAPQAVLE